MEKQEVVPFKAFSAQIKTNLKTLMESYDIGSSPSVIAWADKVEEFYNLYTAGKLKNPEKSLQYLQAGLHCSILSQKILANKQMLQFVVDSLSLILSYALLLEASKIK